jgi:hypothetical protein
MISVTLRAEFLNLVSTEILIKNSMHSAHDNQCDPLCANQENGGVGFILHYKRLDKHLNMAIGRIDLVNSFGDKGRVEFFQPLAGDFELGPFFFEFAVWIMRIYGYTKEERTSTYYTTDSGEVKNVKKVKGIIVEPPPWPKLKVGFNPLYKYTNDFHIDYNYLRFPSVDITWMSLTYGMRF